MAKAFLIKRKTLLQEGIKVKDSYPELIVPFANMQVATSTTDVNQSITLVDEQMLDRKVAASIAGSHRGIQGEVLLLDDAMLQALLATFNAGQEIQIAFGGESITYGINQVNGDGTQKAEVGDIIIVKVEGKRDEEYAVNPNLHLEQLTYNNEEYALLTNIQAQTDSLEEQISGIEDQIEALEIEKANVADVYAKTETYSKIEINASQAGQDAKIEAARVKNVAQDGRLDALELKVNPMEARFTSIESKDVAQDGRLDVVEVQSSQAFAAASRFAAMEGSIVQSGDLSTDIKHIVDFPWTEEGTNVVAALDAPSQVGLVANEKVTIETYRQSNDRWNDVSAKYKDGIQHDELYLETTIVPCDVQIIQDKVIVSGLNQQQRQTLIQNYRIKRIIQAGQQSVGSDEVARTAAATAQTQADTALAKANQALAKIDAIDLTPLTTGVADNKAEIDVIKPKVTTLEAEMLLTQKSADANLQTTSKNVVGAINEVNTLAKAAAPQATTYTKVETDGKYIPLSRITTITIPAIDVWDIETVHIKNDNGIASIPQETMTKIGAHFENLISASMRKNGKTTTLPFVWESDTSYTAAFEDLYAIWNANGSIQVGAGMHNPISFTATYKVKRTIPAQTFKVIA